MLQYSVNYTYPMQYPLTDLMQQIAIICQLYWSLSEIDALKIGLDIARRLLNAKYDDEWYQSEFSLDTRAFVSKYVLCSAGAHIQNHFDAKKCIQCKCEVNTLRTLHKHTIQFRNVNSIFNLDAIGSNMQYHTLLYVSIHFIYLSIVHHATSPRWTVWVQRCWKQMLINKPSS